MRFDLEKSLAAWRRRYEVNLAFLPEDVRELEQHVRDQVQALVARGWSEEEALWEALREMGAYEETDAAYRGVLWGKLKRRRSLLRHLFIQTAMLRNYLKTAARNLLRQKGYSFINVVGLALGLTCCLLIFRFVAFEYSFDRFHEKAGRLYRAVVEIAEGEGVFEGSPLSGYALGPALAAGVPEVARAVRLHPNYGTAVVSNPDRPGEVFKETRIFYTDAGFDSAFTLPRAAGEGTHALAAPGTMLLSASAAKKYFGDANPVGRSLDVNGWIAGSFRVAGVFEDLPPNSHVQFDFLLPMNDLVERGGYREAGESGGWSWQNFLTYVELREGADPAAAQAKMSGLFREARRADLEPRNLRGRIWLQPVPDVHLNDRIEAHDTVDGSARTVYFFMLVGLLTLVIALVNYVNLATARALDRAREVGVRKAVGASRRQLMAQFLLEAGLTILAAGVLAVGLSEALRPALGRFAGIELSGALLADGGFWLGFAAVFVVVLLLAGLYPAFVLSSFRPVSVLKGRATGFAARLNLRRGLVVLQFAASVALVTGTVVVYAQLDFMRRMELGLELDQILVLDAPRVLPEGADRAAAVETFRRELVQMPAVEGAAVSATVPGQGFQWWASARRATADPSTVINGRGTAVDTSFAALYGLRLAAGRSFSGTPPPEEGPREMILNETAVRELGFESPQAALDQLVSAAGREYRVVGVYRDFNWSSAHQAREPVLLYFSQRGGQISVRVRPSDLPATLERIRDRYRALFPGNPFDYTFVDEAFERQYRDDQRFASLFTVFAGLAILIACLGLFGLAAFTAGQRTKELGVRKVLGAGVPGLVALLAKDYLRLVVLAVVLAAPATYWVMSRWLADFAYHVSIRPGYFLVSGLLVLVIALLTVSYQSVRAALAAPVRSLRYE